jgi:hypothetical protein
VKNEQYLASLLPLNADKPILVQTKRGRLRIKQPTRCMKYPKLYFFIKLYKFRASSVPITRSYLLYCPKHVEFYDKIKFWIFDVSSYLFYTKLVTMHGHLNIKQRGDYDPLPTRQITDADTKYIPDFVTVKHVSSCPMFHVSYFLSVWVLIKNNRP